LVSIFVTFYPELDRRLSEEDEQTLISNKETWHRSCYQEAVHAEKRLSVKQRYERELKRLGGRLSEEPSTSGNCTRNSAIPFWVFCQQGARRRNPLYKLATENAGIKLQRAVELGKDDKLKIRLSTSIDPKDAHAIDVRYHKNCWTLCVSTVLRKTTTESAQGNVESEIAAEIKFMSMLDSILLQGSVVGMASLAITFHNIRLNNGLIEQPRGQQKDTQKINSR